MGKRMQCIALAIAMLGIAGALVAQEPARADTAHHLILPRYRYRILGVFDDDSGEPIEGVEVIDVLNGNSALTTKTGTVTLAFLPDGGSMVRLRKVGYGVQTFTVPISPADTAPITIMMNKATTLATVVVTDSTAHYISPALRGFEERKKAGFGRFIDESEMRKNDNHTMADVLVAHLPGLMVVPAPLGAKFIASSRRMCSGPAMRACRNADCYPTVFVDGVRANLGTNPSLPPDWGKISPTDYAAVEFYAGGASAPAEFSGTNNECGILLLWSRER